MEQLVTATHYGYDLTPTAVYKTLWYHFHSSNNLVWDAGRNAFASMVFKFELHDLGDENLPYNIDVMFDDAMYGIDVTRLGYGTQYEFPKLLGRDEVEPVNSRFFDSFFKARLTFCEAQVTTIFPFLRHQLKSAFSGDQVHFKEYLEAYLGPGVLPELVRHHLEKFIEQQLKHSLASSFAGVSAEIRIHALKIILEETGRSLDRTTIAKIAYFLFDTVPNSRIGTDSYYKYLDARARSEWVDEAEKKLIELKFHKPS